MNAPSPRLLLGAILTGYLLLALSYGFVNPLFEAPDEQLHFFTARYIAETGRLPAVDPVTPDPWLRQEAAQPPLYYIVGGALIAPVDTSQAERLVWPNPFVRLGDASAPTNRNAFVHGPAESWPWRDYALAAHLLRGLSTLFGLGTLLLIFGTGRLLWPTTATPALLATGLVAFLPQFLFLHAAITNDVAVTFWSTATLYLLVRQWRGGCTAGSLLLTGAAAGLALLSKMAGLLAIAYAVGFIAVLTWREHGWRWRQALRPTAGRMALLLLTAGAVGGWVLVRNWLLYGDVTATSQFIRLEGARDANLGTVVGELGGIWASFVAVFGWFNVRALQGTYWLWDAVVVAGGLGVLWRLRERWFNKGRFAGAALPELLLPLLLAGWVVLVAAGLVSFMLRTPAAQGRLLFPALLPLALGLGWGLAAWRRAVGATLVLLALVPAILVPAWTLPRTYAPPPVMAIEEIPASAARLMQPLGQGLTLVAVELDAGDPGAGAPGSAGIGPGETVWMTLYWQRDDTAPTAPEAAPEAVIELFGAGEILVGKLQSYHGGGLYPATFWPAGVVVADRIGVPLLQDVPASWPAAARVQVRLVAGDGVATAGFVKVIPAAWPPPAPALAQIGAGIELLQATPDRLRVAPGVEIAVEVEWQVTAAPGRAFTTFVHLGPAGLPPLADGDGVPRAGAYPTTFWAAGERFSDRYALQVPAATPPGIYPLWIGMYDAAGRQPLTVDGLRRPNDAFQFGEVEITAP